MTEIERMADAIIERSAPDTWQNRARLVAAALGHSFSSPRRERRFHCDDFWSNVWLYGNNFSLTLRNYRCEPYWFVSISQPGEHCQIASPVTLKPQIARIQFLLGFSEPFCFDLTAHDRLETMSQMRECLIRTLGAERWVRDAGIRTRGARCASKAAQQ